MAIKRVIQGNTTDIQRLGATYPREFPVDDSLTSGIGTGKLFAVKGDGTSAEFYKGTEGGVGATAIEATSASEETFAVGFVVGSSLKDMYGALNLDPDYTWKPYGTDQEKMTVAPCKGVQIYEYDDTQSRNTPIYRTVTEDLAGTLAVVTGTDAKVIVGTGTAFTADMVGDLISVNGLVREISVFTSTTEIEVSEDFPTDFSGETGRLMTDFDRPVWLTTSGDYTKVKPVTGTKRQEVGRIASGNHILGEIKKPEIIG